MENKILLSINCAANVVQGTGFIDRVSGAGIYSQ